MAIDLDTEKAFASFLNQVDKTLDEHFSATLNKAAADVLKSFAPDSECCIVVKTPTWQGPMVTAYSTRIPQADMQRLVDARFAGTDVVGFAY